MKIFQLNDCDWFIGETLDACKAEYLANYGEDVDDDAHELTDNELDTLMFNVCDGDERLTGENRTFREQLAIEVAAGGEFPRLFASTEY